MGFVSENMVPPEARVEEYNGPRCEVGEDMAKAMWRRNEPFVQFAEPAPRGLREIVFLGFSSGREGETLFWRELTNVTVRDASHSFDVDGVEVDAVVTAVMSEYGEKARCVVLWHSHYFGLKMSIEDVESFPSWMCKWGVVYHAPTETNLLYNEDGAVQFPSLDTSTEKTNSPL